MSVRSIRTGDGLRGVFFCQKVGLDRFFCLLLTLTFTVTLLLPEFCQAERRNRRPPPRKNIRTALSADSSAAFDLKLGSTLDSLVADGTNSNIYDEYTIHNLERMRDLAQPDSRPEDIDPVRTRHVAEKAMAIELGRNFFKLLSESDFKSTYNATRRGIRDFQNFFKYSVQDSGGQGIQVSKQSRGRKLIELNLELNSRQGLDPQLKLSEALRFRYDYLDKKPLLEYEFSF